jgi:hypothetical protein
MTYSRYVNRMGEFDDDDNIPLPPPPKTVKLQFHVNVSLRMLVTNVLGHIRPYSISVKIKDQFSLLLIHHSIYEEVCRSWKIKIQSDPQHSFPF